eukprot:CAMPEP_0174718220 /NCGR_PEP_ID=MMETSP1094-20130205/28322_1 /TAXON_ID=156173 /ORGANISM="Chrysochromulina brevifilum, Strain UTEX LB 985" /LENGTH=103 /DNA_ID=CAMNT_0015918273 /DNA_START=429 /DNA_END=741 /DNA_ORIENTATION=+
MNVSVPLNTSAPPPPPPPPPTPPPAPPETPTAQLTSKIVSGAASGTINVWDAGTLDLKTQKTNDSNILSVALSQSRAAAQGGACTLVRCAHMNLPAATSDMPE